MAHSSLVTEFVQVSAPGRRAWSANADLARAEEVTQQAYLHICQNSSRFDPARGSAMSWLMTIGHRKAVDRVRSAGATT